MSKVGEKVSDFDDEAKWKIMKYNVESDESDAEDDDGKEVVAYIGHSNRSSSSSSDEEEFHFSCEEQKRCGRIVHSVVKELFNFFEGVWGGYDEELKLECFSGKIRKFLQKDHEERLEKKKNRLLQG